MWLIRKGLFQVLTHAGIVFFVHTTTDVKAQIYYSHHFTKKLEQSGMTFIKPVEGFYKIKMKQKDRLMKYDLVLHSTEHEFEMRFYIDRHLKHQVPQVSTFAMASSLAINDEHFDIHMHLFPTERARTDFNADWAAYVDFVPKRSLTDKHFGRLLCIYRPDRAIAYHLMLYNRHDGEHDRRLYALQFQ